jgi:hypothetical protein
VPGRNGAERRSSRVTLRVPLQMYQPGTNRSFPGEEAHSLKASLWGGLIAIKSAVNPGQQLSLINRATRETTESRVVYVGPMQAGRRLVGIGFLASCPGFWGLVFPPITPHRSPARSSFYAWQR